MKKKVLLIIVSVLFVSGAACMFCYKGYKNYLLNHYFNLQEKNPAAEEYLQHVKMEDMDMRVIENMTFRYVRPAVGIKRI